MYKTLVVFCMLFFVWKNVQANNEDRFEKDSKHNLLKGIYHNPSKLHHLERKNFLNVNKGNFHASHESKPQHRLPESMQNHWDKQYHIKDLHLQDLAMGDDPAAHGSSHSFKPNHHDKVSWSDNHKNNKPISSWNQGHDQHGTSKPNKRQTKKFDKKSKYFKKHQNRRNRKNKKMVRPIW